MRIHNRLRLDMAARAAEFCRTHPDDDPQSSAVANRLIELVNRAENLTQQQRSGQVTAAAAVSQKADIRVLIERDLAALIGAAKVASKVASKEHPDLTVHRRMPHPKTNESNFLTIARVAAAEARAARELLAPFGLGDKLLDSLETRIAAYEAALGRQRNALTSQVGAGAELEGVAAAIMDVVRNLDALYRVRFGDDLELKAAWKSARNVAWPSNAPAPEPGPAIDPGQAA